MSDTTAPILSGDTLKKAQQRELERVTQNIIGLLLGIFSAAIWVFTGASSALRDALGGDTNVWQSLLFIVVFILIGTLISFPISFYYGFVVEKRDEMLKQNFVGWLQTALMLIAAYFLMNALNGVGGIRGVTDIAALPILLFCFTVPGELFGLVSNAVSRAAEYAADRFALENTRNYPAFERAFRSLAKDNLSDPNPPAWVEIWLHNHPSIEKRIAAARAWAKAQRV